MKKVSDRLALSVTLLVAILLGLGLFAPLQAAPVAQGTGGLGAAEVAQLLELHNEWRQRFSVPALVWDDTVAATAQDWANHIAATDDFSHRPNNKYGENIWAGSTGFFGPSSVVNSWGSEVSDYDFATNTCAAGKVCGHFTQLVWSATTKVGCGKATGFGNDYYVCNYDPPGNFQGQTPGAKPAPAPATIQPVNPAPTVAPTDNAAAPTAASATAAAPTAANAIPPTLQATPQGTAGLNSADALVMLNALNAVRAKHNVPPLVWDNSVADAAQIWAEQIANTGSFSRPANNPYGSNNYFGTATSATPQDPVDWWSKQASDYDFVANTCAAGKDCRQFTQVVWAATTKVGCGKALANGNAFFVCNFDPSGNVTGQTPGASAEGAPTNTPTATTQSSPTSAASRTPTITPTATGTAGAALAATPTITGTRTVTTVVTSTVTATLGAAIAVTGTATAPTMTPTFSAHATSGLSAADASELLNLQNEWRQHFSVPALVWDDTVAATAQDWADHIAAANDFSHRPNNKYGENIWAGSTGFFGPSSVVNSWGSEVSDYDFATNTCAAGKACGHFTQLVWSATTKVGCGKATGSGNDYYVCNYDPPGNIAGQETGAKPAPAPVASQPTQLPQATAQPTDAGIPTAEATTAPTDAGVATAEATVQPAATSTEAAQPTAEVGAQANNNTSPDAAIPYDTPNLTIAGGDVLWYSMPYDGGDVPIVIRIPNGAANNMIFQVFTLSELSDPANSTHTGMGSSEGDDLVWRGSSSEVGPLFIVVANQTSVPLNFSIVKE